MAAFKQTLLKAYEEHSNHELKVAFISKGDKRDMKGLVAQLQAYGKAEITLVPLRKNKNKPKTKTKTTKNKNTQKQKQKTKQKNKKTKTANIKNII